MRTPARAVTCGMTRLPSLTRYGLPTATGLLVLAALAASCGGSNSASGSHSDHSSTTTTNPQSAAVLAAYRAEQAAFEQAVDHADPTLPALAQTMTGAQLDSVRRALVADQVNGIVGRGTVQLHPKVSYVHGNQALVLDCAFDSSELVYAATGKPVPPVTPPEKVAISSQLTEVSPGVWKVADQHTTNGSCPAGY
jgi:sarcosine oxidase gamma subunit